MSKGLLKIGEVSKILGVSIQTLRRWDKSGELTAFRPSTKGHRYYRKSDLDDFLDVPHDLKSFVQEWIISKKGVELDDEFYCPTSDIFRSRLNRMSIELERSKDFEADSFLVVAIAGEIGNNSFDHNLGRWPDVMGVFFYYDLSKRQVILSDRGRGVLTTLQNACPDLNDYGEALKIAFTKIITGRAPERRGNGLKFVRKIVMQHSMKLIFRSGDYEVKVEKKKLSIRKLNDFYHGCFAILEY